MKNLEVIAIEKTNKQCSCEVDTSIYKDMYIKRREKLAASKNWDSNRCMKEGTVRLSNNEIYCHAHAGQILINLSYEYMTGTSIKTKK